MPEETQAQEQQEAASTNQSGGGANKLLILLIVMLIITAITAIVSIFTFRALLQEEKLAVKGKNVDNKPVAKFDFSKEFLVQLKTEGAIAKFSIQFEVNDESLVQFLTDNEATFRDMIQRIITSYTMDSIKKAFADGSLHKKIMKVVNKYIEENLGPKKPFLGIGAPKIRKVVKVNFPDFLVVYG